jgi:predicted Zn finger-like uncharacterized protein
MPLEVSCPGCSGQFRVPDTAAGKKIRCPKCKGAIDVPSGQPLVQGPAPDVEIKPSVTPARQRPAPAKLETPVEQWHLKTEDGEEYGPVNPDELDQWKAEGRITADCQLLREGDEQWQWATDVFPDLANEDELAADEPVAVPLKRDPKPTAAKQPKPTPKRPAEPSPDELPASSRSRLVAGLLGVFLGPLGTHRFYLGYWVIGLLMLATGGGCGIWSLVDAILVFLKRVPDADGRPLSD